MDICLLRLLCVVRGLCLVLIPRPEDSYQMCLFVYLHVTVIRCNNNRLQLQLIG